MKGIDPKWTMYLGLLVIVEQAIGHGTVSLTNLVPADWAPYITSWCNFLAFIGVTIMTYQGAVSSPVSGPAINTSIAPAAKAAIIAAILLGSFAFPHEAMAQTNILPRVRQLTGNIANDIAAAQGRPSTGITGAPVTDAQNFFNALLLPDLQYALKLSQAAKNTITGDCYQAWIDIITTQQQAVKNADGTDIAMPDPHVITEFEKIVELRNALQPESTFMVKCSPVASMVKKDITGFIGIVVSGGVGLAAMVPGL